jgi:hypothetical protein
MAWESPIVYSRWRTADPETARYAIVKASDGSVIQGRECQSGGGGGKVFRSVSLLATPAIVVAFSFGLPLEEGYIEPLLEDEPRAMRLSLWGSLLCGLTWGLLVARLLKLIWVILRGN